MFNSFFAVLIIFSLGFANISCSQNRDGEDLSKLKYSGKITAPEFPSGAEWLNTDNPISLKDLRGKLVLLDFWTYCCINCIHIIPDLKKLEAKYPDELIVIGVHSAKFLTERGTENIRQAILRYEIEHPVINDKDFVVWNNYTAHAWPTTVLIDPNGKIIKMDTGEGVFEVFDPIISAAIKEYDEAGITLNRGHLEFALEKNKTPKSLLSYPGKIAVDEKTSRIFITDSNNNRILIFKISDAIDEVTIEEVIGTGMNGIKDGSYTEAEFFRPQGITYHNDKLYVADTENHLIREIDLNTKQVKTIAGLGYQSREWGVINGKASETALNSPWDLIVINDALYIAMAGNHQLWKMDLKTSTISTYAGSGRENIYDDALLESALAQPSGITSDGKKIYFADSEVSAIRSADLDENGKISTIVGLGLFVFGDVNGKGETVRLQHPIGVVYNPADNLLYAADTYNNKIKVINPVTKESNTYSGTGVAGNRNGTDGQFNEPNGLAILNGKLYITDTNNNLLRVIDMATKEVKTVKIKNPDKLMANIKQDVKKKIQNAVKLEPVMLKSGDVKLRFNFKLPEGYHINPDAMPQISVSSDGKLTDELAKDLDTKEPVFEVPVKLNAGNGNLNIELLIYYCDTENAGICKFKDLFFELPVNSTSEGENTANINYELN
ncbi:MAG: hypothetical protein EHM58_13015 [Ignavibacteriae bacterium]|nr:MAG: hypothetical protein EHM58_13015 [Ignavibacteriota bacterium]